MATETETATASGSGISDDDVDVDVDDNRLASFSADSVPRRECIVIHMLQTNP